MEMKCGCEIDSYPDGSRPEYLIGRLSGYGESADSAVLRLFLARTAGQEQIWHSRTTVPDCSIVDPLFCLISAQRNAAPDWISVLLKAATILLWPDRVYVAETQDDVWVWARDVVDDAIRRMVRREVDHDHAHFTARGHILPADASADLTVDVEYVDSKVKQFAITLWQPSCLAAEVVVAQDISLAGAALLLAAARDRVAYWRDMEARQ